MGSAVIAKAGTGTYAQTKFSQRPLNVTGSAHGVCACGMAPSLSSAFVLPSMPYVGLVAQ